MSVDYSLVRGGRLCILPYTQRGEGGVYEVSGAGDRAELNVTYNYGKVFAQVWALDAEYPGMIEMLHGKTAEESIPMLEALAAVLPDSPAPDYWQGTEGNAGHAVALLLRMARACPGATWEASG